MKGLAKSTLKSYQSGIHRYKSCCVRINHPALPVTEETLSTFVASLAKDGTSYTSLKVYLVAIWHHQIENGFGDPSIPQMVHLEYILKGIKIEGAQVAKPRRDRQPITPVFLIKLFTIWER